MTGIGQLGVASAFACMGILAGILHLMLLSWNVRALTAGLHSSVAFAASLTRAGVTTMAFALAAFHGALGLIATLAGFLLARTFLIRRLEVLLP
ncbi:MAG TPA: ATP synthase subunit I [Rhizomicrobium sp.]|nr:ATP synthase subunit I [Rhizomicrobium sp.]